jgi:pimeloyl-ACP methyl ester carboxylesterase
MECMGVDNMSERVAIVAVHGVASHPRYEFQDQVAGDLCARLNQRDGGATWELSVINPTGVLEPGQDDPLPTTTRVLRSGDDFMQPKQTFYDVIEAYWSPIDKGATNWLLVLVWILNSVFAPFNTTARIEAPFRKQFFDYGFIGGALVIAFVLFAVSVTAVWLSAVHVLTITGLMSRSSVGDAINVLNANASAPGGARIKIIVWLLVGIAGAFLVGQAVAAIFKTWLQRQALAKNPAAIWHRALAIGVLVVLGGLLIYAMAVVKFPKGSMGWAGVALLIGIFLAFQIGYALLIDFIVGFFGDVQIYTTRDENNARFYGLRDAIMDTAVTAIMRAVTPERNGGYDYDRVIVLSHSLGGTIATDAITRLKQACEQGALDADRFARVRAFAMLGSSLEKTRYFFNVAGTTPSVSYEEWRGTAFEKIFTHEEAVLAKKPGSKIFWVNYWYFQDPICNEIRSYKDVCCNERGSRHLSLLHPLIHSDYLDDPWVWFSSKDDSHLGLLDIIAPVKTS